MAYYSQGLYLARVVDQGFGQSKEKQTPYFFLRILPFEKYVTETEREPFIETYERDILLYVTDKTQERQRERLKSLGWDGQRWQDLDPDTDGYQSLAGAEFVARCQLEQVGDKTYERWDFPGNGGGGQEHQAEPGLSRRLDALFGAASKGGPRTATKISSRQTQTVERRGDVDPDIPF